MALPQDPSTDPNLRASRQACVDHNAELVSYLLDHRGITDDEKRELLSARAHGSFFLPSSIPVSDTRMERNPLSKAYYGEYPYSFAACCGATEVMDVIWKACSELGLGNPAFAADGLGNTALHLAVEYDQAAAVDMILLKHCPRRRGEPKSLNTPGMLNTGGGP